MSRRPGRPEVRVPRPQTSPAVARRHRSLRPLWGLLAVALLLGSVLAGRLLDLQVVNHQELAVQAAEVSTRVVTEPALRGRVLAADGTALVANAPTTVVTIDPRTLLESDDEGRALIEQVAAELDLPVETRQGRGGGVSLDEFGELFRVAALVEHVAGDDQVEFAEPGIGSAPDAGAVLQRRQVIERQVGLQEGFGQGVAIARRRIAAASVDDEAGQAETATGLEDSPAAQIEGLHQPGLLVLGQDVEADPDSGHTVKRGDLLDHRVLEMGADRAARGGEGDGHVDLAVVLDFDDNMGHLRIGLCPNVQYPPAVRLQHRVFCIGHDVEEDLS